MRMKEADNRKIREIDEYIRIGREAAKKLITVKGLREGAKEEKEKG
jgi:hypothetical protein